MIFLFLFPGLTSSLDGPQGAYRVPIPARTEGPEGRVPRKVTSSYTYLSN